MTTINDLPNEILLMIFKYTGNKKDLTCTCKRWNELIVNFLRLSIDLYSCERIRKFLDTTFTRRYHMLCIDDIDSDFDWPDSSRQVKSLGPERSSLGLGCSLLHKCLQLVRQSEGTLREMSLSIGPVMANSLREFLPQGDEPSSLKSLTIKFKEWPVDWIVEQIEPIADEELQEIAEMPKLKSLEFQYVEGVWREDQTARRIFTDEIVRKAKSLTSLSLVECHHDCYSDLRIVQSFSTQLQELYCDISSPFAEDFFQLALPAVKILTLNFLCSERPDATWFFKNAKSLIDLTVLNISTEEFFRQGVYRGATAVERLIIRGEKIPMDGLQGMARLRELELNIDCRQIAVPCSSSLQKLVINGNTNGFNFYGGLAQSLPNTTELCINTEDETWDDDCLRVICTTMTNIRRLTIYHNAFGESVTDMSYRYIGNLRQLEYFCLHSDPTAGVYWFRNIEPNDLNFSNWVSLVWASEIHLSGFRKIDQNKLLCFMKNPKLRRLTLELCVLEDDARKLLSEHEMTVPRQLPHIAYDGCW